MNGRHIEIIYCDDIRHEVGGKVSLIGIYFNVLFVREFPVSLPKLCFFARLISPLDHPIRSLTLRIFKDDDLLKEFSIDDDLLSIDAPSLEESPDENLADHATVHQFNVVISPIVLEEPGKIRVHAQTEEGEMKALSLRIEQMEEQVSNEDCGGSS